MEDSPDVGPLDLTTTTPVKLSFNDQVENSSLEGVPTSQKRQRRARFEEYFNCEQCTASYCSLEFLQKHVQIVHLKTRKPSPSKPVRLICKFCTAIYNSFNFLQQHLISKHEALLYSTDSVSQSYTKTLFFTCEDCRLSFNSDEKLKEHRNHCSKKDSRRCLRCDQLFLSEAIRIRHEFDEHGIKPKHVKLLKCTQCSKIFFTSKQLRQHMRIVHTDDKNFKCEQCDASFKTRSTLNSHRNSMHDKILKHICKDCGKGFKQISHLKLHIDTIHKNLKPFMCDLCQKTFTQKAHIHYHMLVQHLNSKEYHCKICPKSFALQTELNRHMKWHSEKKSKLDEDLDGRKKKLKITKEIKKSSNSKTIECIMCDITFKKPSLLKKHNVSFHTEGAFVCHCRFECVTKYDLIKHQKNTHWESCAVCYQKFSKLNHLKEHLKLVHNIEISVCQKCKQHFSSVLELSNHELNSHQIKDIICVTCQITFSVLSWPKHVEIEHQQVVCKSCLLVFLNEAALTHHKEIIHNFKCIICNATHKSLLALILHEAENHPENRTLCNICVVQKECYASSYIAHLFKDHNKLMCENHCPMNFDSNDELIQHCLSHNDTKHDFKVNLSELPVKPDVDNDWDSSDQIEVKIESVDIKLEC